jgi:hypothetical protein
MVESPALVDCSRWSFCFVFYAPVGRGAILHFFETVLGRAGAGAKRFFKAWK